MTGTTGEAEAPDGAGEVVPAAGTRRRLGLLLRVARWADPRLAALLAGTLVLSALAGTVQSLGLTWVVDAAVEQRGALAVVAAVLGACGAGLLGSAERAMSDTEHVVANQVALRVDRNTLALASSMPGVGHLERPEYLDQLALVRSGGPALVRAVFTLTRTASLAVSMLSSLWLLGLVHPLLVLTPLCAIPTAVLVPRAERHVERARAVAAERQRAATQLHGLLLDPGPAMELRVFDACERVDERSDRLWREVADVQLRGALRGAALAAAGWVALTAGYAGALLFTSHLALTGRAGVGDIVLVSQLALLVRANVAQTAEAARQATAALRTADRFLWLEDVHAEQLAAYAGTVAAPDRLTRGIALRGVSFTYPGTAEPVLRDVDLDLAAGTTVAVVGDNGAGKTTLVKLLTGMYRPTRGAITVDGTDLADLDVRSWRRRIGGTLQDHLRLEATARTTVGVGDPSALAEEPANAPDAAPADDDARIDGAVDRGHACGVVDGLADGLATHLGRAYADGAELSGGQWQRLALARGMMPEAPLCLVLDEPTAALDPEAEQRLFESYHRAATASAERGAVTVLVSHRFSSVRMADTIVVLAGGRVAERGTHADLVAAGGPYARMYGRQAAAYA